MGAAARLVIGEDLTIYQIKTLKDKVLAALQQGSGLELDLQAVTQMDTAGFQLLVLAKRESQRLGRTLRIIAHSPAVREVIEFYNMAAFFGDPVVIPAAERS